MVDRRDVLVELRAQRPSGKRHERLEPAEEQRDDQSLPHVQPLHAQPLAHGHGERVHGQAHPYQQQLDETHGIVLSSFAAIPTAFAAPFRLRA